MFPTVVIVGGHDWDHNTMEELSRRLSEASKHAVTLRDWFAGHALAAMIASNGYKDWGQVGKAGLAYEYADAMLAERAK